MDSESSTESTSEKPPIPGQFNSKDQPSDDLSLPAVASESSAESTAGKPPIPGQSERPTPKHEFKGHEGAVRSFVFLHDNVHIVSGSCDGTMRKWDCKTGRLIGEPWKGKGGNILVLALSPDAETIACGMASGMIERWNTNGVMIEDIQWTGHSNCVRSLSWSHNGCHIASGSDDGKILIRKAESGEVVVTIETKQSWVNSLAYSPSDDRIASGGCNDTICVWDSDTGELIFTTMQERGPGVGLTTVAWSLDSSQLYSSSSRFARVYDSSSGTELHRFQHDKSLSSIALSSQNLLACVGESGVAQLWNTESQMPIGQPFHQEKQKHLNCVSFSPDGRYVAYGGDDRGISLWMVKDIVPDIGQETQPHSPSSPFDSDAHVTSFFASPFNDITEDRPHHPYHNFFSSSQSSLPSPRRRLLQAFSLLRPPRSLKLRMFAPRPPLGYPSQVSSPAVIDVHPARVPSFQLDQRPRLGSSAEHTEVLELHPVRPNKWTALRRVMRDGQSAEEENGNTDVCARRSSAAVQSSSAASVTSAASNVAALHPQSQPVTLRLYGYWINFWTTACCIPRATV